MQVQQQAQNSKPTVTNDALLILKLLGINVGDEK